ncbi:MAG: type II toxin-antitoxin system PemK/MazF family toxin [Acidimicrobiales bacterium]
MTTSAASGRRGAGILQRGQLVRVPFPYTNQADSKTRPACVISVPAYNSGPDFIVAMVTSSARFLQQPGLGDVVISDWRAAGLQQRSVIRAGRLLVVERPLLVRSLGRVTPSDRTALDQALKAVLGLT